MEFSDYKCPVCNETFKSGDDVVVCPECGAPHHRECYEKNGHCFYEDRHSDDFNFENADADDNQDDSEFLECPNCHYQNEKTAFYCNKCGQPLSAEYQNQAQQNTQQNANPYNQGFNNGQSNFQGMPFGFGIGGMPTFDPLAGMNGEEEIAENVKVSEAAKYIGKSTQYFLPVFKKIKNGFTARFNFSAMVFAEVYFLYRKMTVLGVIISLIMISTSVASTAIMMSPEWINSYNSIMASMRSGVSVSLFSSDLSFMYIPLALQGLRLVIRILSGLFANRLYYSHCSKRIQHIKAEKPEDLSKTLEQKGGVNLPLAASFYAASMIISYIGNFIAQF